MLRRLNVAFARADRLEAEAARARALLDRLESAILAKAFRGELIRKTRTTSTPVSCSTNPRPAGRLTKTAAGPPRRPDGDATDPASAMATLRTRT